MKHLNPSALELTPNKINVSEKLKWGENEKMKKENIN